MTRQYYSSAKRIHLESTDCRTYPAGKVLNPFDQKYVIRDGVTSHPSIIHGAMGSKVTKHPLLLSVLIKLKFGHWVEVGDIFFTY